MKFTATNLNKETLSLRSNLEKKTVGTKQIKDSQQAVLATYNYKLYATTHFTLKKAGNETSEK